jgi:translation initiation factor IF-3
MLGEFSVNDGIKKAQDVGLDLVEISPNTNPPICKILDLGKYKYQQQKKQNKQKKKQKISITKEVRFRPGIDDHDYQIKMKKIQKFLQKGDKVKVTLRWRGREFYGNRELGKNLFIRIKEDIKDISAIEQEPKMLGRQLIMVLNPLN